MNALTKQMIRLGTGAAMIITLAGCVANPHHGGGTVVAPPPPPPVRQAFNDPKAHGKWLDICAQKGSCRTQKALDTYCQRRGYERAVGHTQAVSPIGHQNMRIADRSICTTIVGNCTRVTRVTCEKQG